MMIVVGQSFLFIGRSTPIDVRTRLLAKQESLEILNDDQTKLKIN